VTMDIKQTKEY